MYVLVLMVYLLSCFSWFCPDCSGAGILHTGMRPGRTKTISWNSENYNVFNNYVPVCPRYVHHDIFDLIVDIPKLVKEMIIVSK